MKDRTKNIIFVTIGAGAIIAIIGYKMYNKKEGEEGKGYFEEENPNPEFSSTMQGGNGPTNSGINIEQTNKQLEGENLLVVNEPKNENLPKIETGGLENLVNFGKSFVQNLGRRDGDRSGNRN